MTGEQVPERIRWAVRTMAPGPDDHLLEIGCGPGVAVEGDGMLAVGQSNSTTFLRPVTAGSVHAEGVPLHRGRTTWVWDVRFTDDDERLCAISRMTMAGRPQTG